MEYIKFYISEINTNLLKTIGGRQGELIGNYEWMMLGECKCELHSPSEKS